MFVWRSSSHKSTFRKFHVATLFERQSQQAVLHVSVWTRVKDGFMDIDIIPSDGLVAIMFPMSTVVGPSHVRASCCGSLVSSCAWIKLRTNAQSTKPEPRAQLSKGVPVYTSEQSLSCGAPKNMKLKPVTSIEKHADKFQALAFKFRSNLQYQCLATSETKRLHLTRMLVTYFLCRILQSITARTPFCALALGALREAGPQARPGRMLWWWGCFQQPTCRSCEKWRV